MIPVALINSALIGFLVVLLLLFIGYLWRMVDTISYGLAFRRHDPNTIFAPFFPLLTRPFRELASPQYVASLAILRGDVPEVTSNTVNRTFSRDHSERRRALLMEQERQRQGDSVKEEELRQVGGLATKERAEDDGRGRDGNSGTMDTSSPAKGGAAAASPEAAVSTYLNGFLSASQGSSNSSPGGISTRGSSKRAKHSSSSASSQEALGKSKKAESTTLGKPRSSRSASEDGDENSSSGGSSSSPRRRRGGPERKTASKRKAGSKKSSSMTSPHEVVLDIREEATKTGRSGGVGGNQGKERTRARGVPVLGLFLPAELSTQPQQRVQIRQKKVKVELVPGCVQSAEGAQEVPSLTSPPLHQEDSQRLLELFSASDSVGSLLAAAGLRSTSSTNPSADFALHSNNSNASTWPVFSPVEGDSSLQWQPRAHQAPQPGEGNAVGAVSRLIEDEMLVAEVAARVGAEYAAKGKGSRGAQERMADYYVAHLLEAVAAHAAAATTTTTTTTTDRPLGTRLTTTDGSSSNIHPGPLEQQQRQSPPPPGLSLTPEQLRELKKAVVERISAGAMMVSRTLQENLRLRALQPKYTSLIFTSELRAVRQLMYLRPATSATCVAVTDGATTTTTAAEGSSNKNKDGKSGAVPVESSWRPLLPPVRPKTQPSQQQHRRRYSTDSVSVGSEGSLSADASTANIHSRRLRTNASIATAGWRDSFALGASTTSSLANSPNNRRHREALSANYSSYYRENSALSESARRDSVLTAVGGSGTREREADQQGHDCLSSADDAAQGGEGASHTNVRGPLADTEDADRYIWSASSPSAGTNPEVYKGPSPGSLSSAQEFLVASAIADNNRRAGFAAAAAMAYQTHARTLSGNGSSTDSSLCRSLPTSPPRLSTAEQQRQGVLQRQGTMTYVDDLASLPQSHNGSPYRFRPHTTHEDLDAGPSGTFPYSGSAPPSARRGSQYTRRPSHSTHRKPNHLSGAETLLALSAGRATAELAPPSRTDLRVAYVIGADRTALLRAMTVNATRTFIHGAVNFVCFYTHADERRAVRRRMILLDRQNRQELGLLSTHHRTGGGNTSTSTSIRAGVSHPSPVSAGGGPSSPSPSSQPSMPPPVPSPTASHANATSTFDSWDQRRRVNAYQQHQLSQLQSSTARSTTTTTTTTSADSKTPQDDEREVSSGLPHALVRPNRLAAPKHVDVNQPTPLPASRTAVDDGGNNNNNNSNNGDGDVDDDADDLGGTHLLGRGDHTSSFHSNSGAAALNNSCSFLTQEERRNSSFLELRATNDSAPPYKSEDEASVRTLSSSSQSDLQRAIGGCRDDVAAAAAVAKPTGEVGRWRERLSGWGNASTSARSRNSESGANLLSMQSLATARSAPHGSSSSSSHDMTMGEDTTFVTMLSDPIEGAAEGDPAAFHKSSSRSSSSSSGSARVSAQKPRGGAGKAPGEPPGASAQHVEKRRSSFLSIASTAAELQVASSLVDPTTPAGAQDSSTAPYTSTLRRKQWEEGKNSGSTSLPGLMNANPAEANLPAADVVDAVVAEDVEVRVGVEAGAPEEAKNRSRKTKTDEKKKGSKRSSQGAPEAPALSAAAAAAPHVEEIPLPNPNEAAVFRAPIGVSLPHQTYLIVNPTAPPTGSTRSRGPNEVASGGTLPPVDGQNAYRQQPSSAPSSPATSMLSMTPTGSAPGFPPAGSGERKKRKQRSRKAPKLAPSLRDAKLMECTRGPSDVEVSELALDALRRRVAAYVRPLTPSSSRSSGSQGSHDGDSALSSESLFTRSTSSLTHTSSDDDSGRRRSRRFRNASAFSRTSRDSSSSSRTPSSENYTTVSNSSNSSSSSRSSSSSSRRGGSRNDSRRSRRKRGKGRTAKRGDVARNASSSSNRASSHHSSHRKDSSKKTAASTRRKSTASSRKRNGGGGGDSGKRRTHKHTRRREAAARQRRRQRRRGQRQKARARLRRRLRKQVLMAPQSASLPVALAIMFFAPVPSVEVIPFALPPLIAESTARARERSMKTRGTPQSQSMRGDGNQSRTGAVAKGRYDGQAEDTSEMSLLSLSAQSQKTPAAAALRCCVTLIYGATAVAVADAVEQARRDAALAEQAVRRPRGRFDDDDELVASSTQPAFNNGTASSHMRADSYSLGDSFRFSMTMPGGRSGTFVKEVSMTSDFQGAVGQLDRSQMVTNVFTAEMMPGTAVFDSHVGSTSPDGRQAASKPASPVTSADEQRRWLSASPLGEDRPASDPGAALPLRETVVARSVISPLQVTIENSNGSLTHRLTSEDTASTNVFSPLFASPALNQRQLTTATTGLRQEQLTAASVTLTPEIVILSDHDDDDSEAQQRDTGSNRRRPLPAVSATSPSALAAVPVPGGQAAIDQARGEDDEHGHNVPANTNALGRLTDPRRDILAPIVDAHRFPEGLSVPVTLHYVRIGDSLYVVTEVVDRTFIQYRERRVLNPNKASANGSSARVGSFTPGNSGTDDTDTDVGDDPEPSAAAATSSSSGASFPSVFDAFNDSPMMRYQREQAETRKRRSRRRHAAVSTLGFGDLTYSFAAPAVPPEPGVRRELVHMCWRCLSAEARAIFLPCGHYAACESCAEELSDCCVCKTKVLSLILLDDEAPS